jgi:hypothetical protein
MKKVSFKSQILTIFFLAPFAIFAQNAYMIEEANTYFKAGRYWDSFFRYRDCSKLPEYEAEQTRITEQIKNSSRALFLTQKYKDFRALRKYQLAKDNLIQLVELNPNDPYRGEIPRLTVEQASELQRIAWRQSTKKATAEMLVRAKNYYYQAIKEGLMDESLQYAIRQCDASIKDTEMDESVDKTIIANTTTINTTQQLPSQQTQTPTPATVGSVRKPTVEILPQKKDN